MITKFIALIDKALNKEIDGFLISIDIEDFACDYFYEMEKEHTEAAWFIGEVSEITEPVEPSDDYSHFLEALQDFKDGLIEILNK